MAVTVLNGWTAPMLDDMRTDVTEIQKTLAKMQSEETRALRQRVKDLEARPRTWLLALGGPVVAAFLGALLSHAF